MAGGVTSQISGDGLGGWDKFGLYAGGWVLMPFSENTGLMLGMKYINKGSRTKQDSITFQSFGYYLNYIDVPLLFSYTTRTREKTSLEILIGPYIGYLLNQKIISNSMDREIIPAFESLDIGAEVGVKWNVSENVGITGLLTSSILPTRPNPAQVNPLSYYEKGNYNQTIQLGLYLRFGKKQIAG